MITDIVQPLVFLYTDGSYCNNRKITSWAYIIVDASEKILKQDRGELTGEITALWQIGGEMKAVMEGLNFCRENNLKAIIYHDYNGLFHWVSDLFGETPWKAKNEWTKKYRTFIINNANYIDSFQWVKSHSKNKFNEVVDKLAKIK